MTLKQLTYFLKIAETGNLTKAAQLLNISQPPLSYQLKLLEEELGVTLFTRDSRNLRITNEGIYLQNKTTQILALIQQTVDDLHDFSTIAPTIINIGTVSSVNHNMLPTIIKEYKQHYPHTVFNIHDGSSIRIMELLDNGIIDIGILREPFNHSLYSCQQIKMPDSSNDENDYFVVTGRREFFHDYSQGVIDFSDVVNLPLVIHRRFEESFLYTCMEKNVKPNIISRNDNIITSIEWTVNGLGCAIMPYSSSLLIDDDNVVIKKIIHPVSYANLYLVWSKNANLPLSLLEFINLF